MRKEQTVSWPYRPHTDREALPYGIWSHRGNFPFWWLNLSRKIWSWGTHGLTVEAGHIMKSWVILSYPGNRDEQVEVPL